MTFMSTCILRKSSADKIKSEFVKVIRCNDKTGLKVDVKQKFIIFFKSFVCFTVVKFQPEMHIQIQKDYFETHFHNLSAEFNFEDFYYEKVIPRNHLKVEWQEQECKILYIILII